MPVTPLDPELIRSDASSGAAKKIPDAIDQIIGKINEVIGDVSAKVVNVRDYGAVGNGVADDTAAIQSAIDAATAAGGGIVWFPVGVYLVSNQAGVDAACVYVKTGCVLWGESKTGSVIKLDAGQPNFTRPFVVYQATDVCIQNLTVDGNKANQTVDEHRAAIFIDTFERVVLQDLILHDNSGDAAHFFVGNDVVMQRCYCHDNDRKAVSITGGPCSNMTVRDCQFIDNWGGQLHIESQSEMSYLRFEDSYVGYPVGAANVSVSLGGITRDAVISGVTIFGTLGVSVDAKRVRIQNCRVETAAGRHETPLGISFNVEDCIVEGCVIIQGDDQDTEDHAVLVQAAFSSDPERPRGIIIRDNHIETSYAFSHGISLVNTESVTIEGNSIVNPVAANNGRSAVSIVASDPGFSSPQVVEVFITGNKMVDWLNGVTVFGAANEVGSLVVSNNIVRRVAVAACRGWDLDPVGTGPLAKCAVFDNELAGTFVGPAFQTYPTCPILVKGERTGGGEYLVSGSPEGVITEIIGATAASISSSHKYVKTAGYFDATGWSLAAGATASGSITCVAKASYVDTDYMTIGDGLSAPVAYEFDTAGDGVTAGRVQVNVSGSTTPADVAAVLKTAIEGAQPAIAVTDAGSGVLTLAAKITGTFANVTITENVADAGHLVSGMAGGLDPVT